MRYAIFFCEQCSVVMAVGSAFVSFPISMGTSSVKSALTVFCCFLVLDMSLRKKNIKKNNWGLHQKSEMGTSGQIILLQSLSGDLFLIYILILPLYHLY